MRDPAPGGLVWECGSGSTVRGTKNTEATERMDTDDLSRVAGFVYGAVRAGGRARGRHRRRQCGGDRGAVGCCCEKQAPEVGVRKKKMGHCIRHRQACKRGGVRTD